MGRWREGGREPLGSASLQNSNTQSLCKPRRCPIQVERHFETARKISHGWELKHSPLLSRNLKPPSYFPNPNLFQQAWFKMHKSVQSLGYEAQKFLELLSMHFLFPAKFHSSTKIFSICLYSIPVKSWDPESGNEPRQKMVDKLLPGKVMGSEMSQLIPVGI